MRDFTDEIAGLRKRIGEAEHYLRIDVQRARFVELETAASRPDLWDDRDEARRVTSELSNVRDDLAIVDGLMADLGDIETLYELAREEGDDSFEEEIAGGIVALSTQLDDLELRSLFAGEHDESDAICEIHAGEGGTDAQDWAEMMLRMYLRWAETKGFDTEIDEVSAGKEAGLLSATFMVKGRFAYGWLRGEQGVHRLVRISPFDAASRRQTSFASLDVTPFIEDASEEVEIDEKDLRIDTYRSSGAGGQHVNVTDSAVRITHNPSGVVVSCQNERSQHQNKARAMQILAAKLVDLQRAQRLADMEAISGTASQAAMGNQIRSYVQAPYQLVKDLRTNHETGSVDGVLDGQIGGFMEAFLRWERAQGASS
ncbi:MAG: peptide chain release factor 2 [Actinobacteria bacterium]|nr:peptide chain release factor 2 [Actinomycetota bacterium]MBI3256814.1 peptide chain release factor 2 [Actinomycetota bacterium]